VTTIGGNAFYDCNSLTSVTFAPGSAITGDNFASNAFPPSEGYGGSDVLKTAYLADGAGRYTYTSGSGWIHSGWVAVVSPVTFSDDMLSTGPADLGLVEALGNGSGYTWTATGSGWNSEYACFRFDLGEPLSNFSKITFVYNRISGDTVHKGVRIYADTSPITDYLYFVTGQIGIIPGYSAVTDGVDNAVTVDIDTAGLTASEWYFAIEINGINADQDDEAASYTITDVVFSGFKLSDD